MTSRERLLTTLNHREPDRVPVMFWGTIAPLRHLWKTPDYPWDNPPLVADHNWSRATEFLVKGPEDLDKLRYVFHDPARGDLASFREQARHIKGFCEKEQVLVNAPVASPSNFAMGLVGANNMMLHSVDHRGFILATADAIMKESAHDNMMTMIQTCHEFGRYPIAT